MTSAATLSAQPRRSGGARRFFAWLGAMPHPATVLEIAATHVAAARWGRDLGHLSAFASEPLPSGVVAPSAVQANVLDPEALGAAIRKVMSRVPHQGQDIALLVPDPAIRVLILSFDTFPRGADDALPLLRWRLKKILPFDAEEASISWMRQSNREGKIEIVAAVARQKVIHEYEAAAEAAGALPGVLQSSTLATLPLLDQGGAELLARWSGANLTTVIVRGDTLCVYRSTEIGSGDAHPSPQAVIDEVFPAVAFYQDTWGEQVGQLRVAGFGPAEEAMREALSREIGCPAAPLAGTSGLSQEARSIVAQGLESLVGWQCNAAV